MTSDDGYKTFLLSYRYKGSNWSLEIMAESFADAELRAQQIRQSLKVDGELMVRIPVSGAGLWSKLRRWLG